MREAAFSRGGRAIVAPQNISLEPNGRLAHSCDGERAASIVAMMAAGLVKATSGRVFVGAFDPRIQPVHVKRLAGFVPHDALVHEFSTFERYIEYRAELWSLQPAESVVRARRILEGLHGIHEAFAYPLAGALMAQPRLLVFDRPQTQYAPQIAHAAAHCAIFSTHASADDAMLFARASEVSA